MKGTRLKSQVASVGGRGTHIASHLPVGRDNHVNRTAGNRIRIPIGCYVPVIAIVFVCTIKGDGLGTGGIDAKEDTASEGEGGAELGHGLHGRLKNIV